MTRGDARELAVHLIFGRTFTQEEPEQVVSVRLAKEYYGLLAAENEIYADRPSRKQLAYIDQVVAGVANREEELNAIISKYSIGWDVSRISRLTRSVLQLALLEIQWVEDVPTGVAIAEAVRLAKKYDGDDTGTFVNGILGTFARSLEQNANAEPVQTEPAVVDDVASAEDAVSAEAAPEEEPTC